MAQSKADIELAAMNAPPGILPPNTKFESYIGHNVINISNYELNEHQLKVLEKGLTFCPTPPRSDKSEIWNDFKEFHRRLELAQFFKLTNEKIDLEITQSIIDFMNKNAEMNKKIRQSITHTMKFTKNSKINQAGNQNHQTKHLILSKEHSI